jgi:L,D-peptidoglycan transpeptidase YkuD (ErfK/YbiS/YcfS/YnhG family)
MGEKRCCGNCKWWEEYPYDPYFGDCTCPFPISADSTDRDDMKYNYGKDCPCHSAFWKETTLSWSEK